MPVLPCRTNFVLEHKEIYQFLLTYQQNCPKTVSISLKIPEVDPLTVLHKISKPDQLSFYFENKSKGEAIAAIDAVAKLEIEGKERFQRAQNFINSCLTHITSVGVTNHSFAGPRFFCSFSFFDRSVQANYPFPAATVFLPRWQIAYKRGECVLVANLVINKNTDLELFLQDLCRIVESISLSKSILVSRDAGNHKSLKEDVTSIDNFKKAVLSSLESIRCNRLNKIVLAHTLDVTGTPFSLWKSLNNLRLLHPDCYVFSIGNGKGQNFVGASPERLISIHARQLKTDALAGSAARGKTATEDAALANRLLTSEKERREHQVVIDFICQCLHELGIVPTQFPLQLKQLSNIQHLWTPIQGEVPVSVQPLEIVAQLHPTPAVAGDARDTACRAICRHESFERGLYAAPLGWVDYQGNSEFIVGIRSALIDGDRARLYAGAGIVAGSDPDKELAEIQLKLQALLKALV
jgi:menaquinone-specific isochorismate synthase